jgi:hypothetical protein
MTKNNSSEFLPKKGEMILVSNSETNWEARMFLSMDDDRFVCMSPISGNEYAWKYAKPKFAKPIEQPKEVPFTPTVGKVAYMKADGDEDNFVFIGKLGDKFMGCNIDEYDDLIKNYGGEVFLFDSIEPARDLVKEVTFSEAAQAFNTPVDRFKIKGYYNEADAMSDIKKLLLERGACPESPLIVSIYDIIVRS